MASTYQTEGRKRLLAFLLKHPDKQFTVDELSLSLSKEHPELSANTGKSSLYRQLSRLCDEGAVRKYRSDTQSSFVYQYVGHGDCSHHFHLKCIVCGHLTHLDCALSDELLSHIQSDHNFRIDSGRSILYGLCGACEKEGTESMQGTFLEGKVP